MPGQGVRWGWHRLDERQARRVVAAAGVGPDDLVVDLGAGTGALTLAALDVGARVLAVELHAGRAAALRRSVRGLACEVVVDDVRRVGLPRVPHVVVANPPWAVLEELRSRLQGDRRLRRADLVVPRWVAQRWAERHPGVGVGLSLRAEAFSPPAPCGAAVAVLRPVRPSRGGTRRRPR